MGRGSREVPHLVRVPARLLVLVEQVLLSKLPRVAIQHRTHPGGTRITARRGTEPSTGSANPELCLQTGQTPRRGGYCHCPPPPPRALTCSLCLRRPKSGSFPLHKTSRLRATIQGSQKSENLSSEFERPHLKYRTGTVTAPPTPVLNVPLINPLPENRGFRGNCQ